MKKKGKKKGGSYKLTVKSEDPAAQKMELQMKKNVLQDKYIIQKTKTEEAVKRLEEARTRFVEVGQFKNNEFDKYKAIESDFVHQSVLMDKIFKEKLEELRIEKEQRENKKKELNDVLNQMKIEHEKRIEEKNEMFKEIKAQMDALSNHFSKELTDIQKELQKQTEKISEKWEKNPSEHIKSFEKEVSKYDVTKNEEKNIQNNNNMDV